MILGQQPFQKVLLYQGTCQRWRQVINTMMANKSSIKVFSHQNDILHYLEALPEWNLHYLDLDEHGNDRNDFSLKPLDSGNDELIINNCYVFDKLPEMFPNLQRLTVFYDHERGYWQAFLNHLLGQMPQLEALVIFNMNTSNHGALSRDFWQSLNEMPHLNELHLFQCSNSSLYPYTFSNNPKKNHRDPNDWIIPNDVWALERLKRFSITEYPGHIGAILQTLGAQCNELLIDKVYLSVDHLRLCLDANFVLKRSLTRLTIGNLNYGDKIISNYDYLALLRVICGELTNLRSLQILYQEKVSNQLRWILLVVGSFLKVSWSN